MKTEVKRKSAQYIPAGTVPISRTTNYRYQDDAPTQQRGAMFMRTEVATGSIEIDGETIPFEVCSNMDGAILVSFKDKSKADGRLSPTYIVSIHDAVAAAVEDFKKNRDTLHDVVVVDDEGKILPKE